MLQSALWSSALALVALLTSAAAGFVAAEDAAETTSPRQAVVATPLVAAVMSQPWAVEGSDGLFHVVYEIRISNVTPLVARLDHVRVLDGKTKKSVATFDGGEIEKRFEVGANRDSLSRQLDGAAFGVLFLHVAVPTLADVPATITHEIDFTLDPGGKSAQQINEEVASTAVAKDPTVVLGPPLRGRNYIAGDSCCDTIRHVRALLPLNGRFWLAQRFAIDWEQIDDENRIFVGDRSDVRSYHIYGKPVLAVADGKAVVVHDGLADQVPQDPKPITNIADADGNHVLQDIGNGAYVLYAHMKPESVRSRVKEGAVLRKGQVIGLVGNTGNTTEPHLHLHVVSRASTLLANGIPYVFEPFKMTGVDTLGTPDFDKGAAQGTPLAITPVDPSSFHQRQLPLDLIVVDWLNGARKTGQP